MSKKVSKKTKENKFKSTVAEVVQAAMQSISVAHDKHGLDSAELNLALMTVGQTLTILGSRCLTSQGYGDADLQVALDRTLAEAMGLIEASIGEESAVQS